MSLYNRYDLSKDVLVYAFNLLYTRSFYHINHIVNIISIIIIIIDNDEYNKSLF